jgi:leucyl aminopeptidase
MADVVVVEIHSISLPFHPVFWGKWRFPAGRSAGCILHAIWMTDMPLHMNIEFAALANGHEPVTVLLVGRGPTLGKAAKAIDKASGQQISRAMDAADFKGSTKQSVVLHAPQGTDFKRLVCVGVNDADDATPQDWVVAGGYAAGQIMAAKSEKASIVVDVGGGLAAPVAAAEIALGALLRSYTFDIYKTTKGTTDDNNSDENGAEKKPQIKTIVIHTEKPSEAEEMFVSRRAIAEGACLARDLVNEPANVLGPVEFAERCEALRDVGVDVEILDVAALNELGMRSLLAVAQGSERPARVAVMQWHGAKSKRAKPLCFIGKGVCFDTGGISMKPAGGMEDMKGDMGGAACVVGLMHALAGRKANVNAIGIVGLVENMPSGSAQRPGDIVKSMSGQTIEVINTDAEGRLVLADLLTYANQRFSPRFMVNLATLTGAIIVALGKENAGLFSNDDKLSSDLTEAGLATGETVWRMPLGKAYDKMIDTPNADMKNIGGRWGGAITAAQFLQRFVDDTPWAHLDVAGVAMASGKTEISRTWASGWGVRLLNELVQQKYER